MFRAKLSTHHRELRPFPRPPLRERKSEGVAGGVLQLQAAGPPVKGRGQVRIWTGA
jgi:hypothetical protein